MGQALSPQTSYLAMYYFVRAYWERGGRRDGSITLLCQALGPRQDAQNPEAIMTNDPAFWNDWLQAIERTRTEGFPSDL